MGTLGKAIATYTGPEPIKDQPMASFAVNRLYFDKTKPKVPTKYDHEDRYVDLATNKPLGLAAPLSKADFASHAKTDIGEVNRMRFNREERSFFVRIPDRLDQMIKDSPDGKAHLYIALNFHGIFSNARQQAEYTHMADVGAKHQWIVVHPEGSRHLSVISRMMKKFLPLALDVHNWDGMTDSWWYKNHNDVKFVAELVDKLPSIVREQVAKQHPDIDPSKIDVVTDKFAIFGLSNGAFLCHDLAARMPERILSLVAIAGKRPQCTERIAPDNPPAIPTLLIHGKYDPVVEYEERNWMIASGFDARPEPETARRIAGKNGCDPDDYDTTRYGERFEVLTWNREDGNPRAIVKTITGHERSYHHTVPGCGDLDLPDDEFADAVLDLDVIMTNTAGYYGTLTGIDFADAARAKDVSDR